MFDVFVVVLEHEGVSWFGLWYMHEEARRPTAGFRILRAVQNVTMKVHEPKRCSWRQNDAVDAHRCFQLVMRCAVCFHLFSVPVFRGS